MTSASGSELWELVEDLESLPLVDAREPNIPGTSDSEEASDETTTSHDFGVQWQRQDESTASEVEDHNNHHQNWWSRLGSLATFTKGKKRKVRHGVNEVCEAFHAHRPARSVPRAHPMPPVRPPVRPYYKVLEIFTWTMAITMCAVQRGWTGCGPVTLPRWNLEDGEHRDEAMRYIVKEEPDLVVLAWPCTVWPPLQYYGVEMTWERWEQLQQRREDDREDFLSFVHEVVKQQRRWGRAHLGENPLRSAAWKEPYIQSAYEDEYYGKTGMCSYGWRRPDTKELLKKPTALAGTREIVEACCRPCNWTSPHGQTLGTFLFQGQRRSIAEFAGGYTKGFARQVIKGAELFLDNWSPEVCRVFVEDDVPEERFMEDWAIHPRRPCCVC